MAWYLADRLGSVRDILNASTQAVGDHLDYDGFGNRTETASSYGDRYKWTGREYDPDTSFQYNRARFYDSARGRWAQEDPKGFQAGDPNLYRYAGDDPVMFTDPSGLMPNKRGFKTLSEFMEVVREHSGSSQMLVDKLYNLQKYLQDQDGNDWIYLWSMRDNNFIDVQHFTRAAWVTLRLYDALGEFDVGIDGAASTTEFLGVVNEFGQAIVFLPVMPWVWIPRLVMWDNNILAGTYHSAFTREDIYSNGLGAEFAKEAGSGFWKDTFASDLEAFLRKHDVWDGKPPIPDHYPIPETEDDWVNHVDPWYGPLTRMGEYMQRNWFDPFNEWVANDWLNSVGNMAGPPDTTFPPGPENR